MNFVDKDGTTKVYIPVHPWTPSSFWNAGDQQEVVRFDLTLLVASCWILVLLFFSSLSREVSLPCAKIKQNA